VGSGTLRLARTRRAHAGHTGEPEGGRGANLARGAPPSQIFPSGSSQWNNEFTRKGRTPYAKELGSSRTGTGLRLCKVRAH